MKAVSGKDLAKALTDKGWTLHHIQGSHHYFTKTGEAAILSVPIHAGKTLKNGTQARLTKLAGLVQSDL